MLHMGNDETEEPTQYGPALMAYVDKELAARGVTPTAFAHAHGLTVAQFGRWRSGQIQPRLSAIVELAHALGKSPIELLALTIGAVREGEPGACAVTEAPRVGDAIELDPTLTPREREMMRDIWGSFQKWHNGGQEVVARTRRGHRNH